MEVPILGHPYDITASVGSSSNNVEGVAPGINRVELALVRPGGLKYRIVDAATGESLALPRVRLGWRSIGAEEYDYQSGAFTDVPDPKGWYDILIPSGRYDLQLIDDRHYGVYVPALVEGVQIASEGEPTRVEFVMRKGLRVELRLAEGMEPPPDGHRIFLIEEELWKGVRWIEERDSWEGGSSTAPLIRRMIRFDGEGKARIHGLLPSRFRFKVFPDDITIEPAEIQVDEELTEPVVVRWRRDQ